MDFITLVFAHEQNLQGLYLILVSLPKGIKYWCLFLYGIHVSFSKLVVEIFVVIALI